MRVLSVVLLGAFACAAAVAQETTTTAAPTTEKPTTKPTDKPTTTPKPTDKPTTVKPTDKPTTLPPTTEAPTTTTPKPKPTEPTHDNYTLVDKDGTVCLFALMSLTVIHNNTERVPVVNGKVNAKDSICGEKEIALFAEFDGGKFQLKFVQNENKSYFIQEVSVEAGDISADNSSLALFDTPLDQFYKCNAAFEVNLGENEVRVMFQDVKLQAFKKDKTATFVGKELECVSDYHSDVVIIAIGCALALLVVIILVAYLIARRRNRQRGYQSV